MSCPDDSDFTTQPPDSPIRELWFWGASDLQNLTLSFVQNG